MCWALSAGEPLEVVGAGSKRALGRPVAASHRLDLSALSGIVSYEPEELVLTARAGTRIQEIEALLAQRHQCLAFEPPDLGPLLAASGVSDAGERERGRDVASAAVAGGTLGGIVSTGYSGPRRFKAGAVRDHVLGIAAVSGRGEAFVGGGKVVKNVTGYDMPKLLAGAFGTLAVLTEITVKVLPAPEDTRTVLVEGLAPREAVHLMTRVLQSPLDVTGASHVPAGVRAPGKSLDASITALRLEGFRPSVEFRLTQLRTLVASSGPVVVLERDESKVFWQAVRDVQPFVPPEEGDRASVWRISAPPAQGAAVLERIQESIPETRAFLDWGGGLIWLRVPNATGVVPQTIAARIRDALVASGGHATLMRAPESVRAVVDVFQPPAAGVAELSRRVKLQFDPSRVLNPGRLYAGV